jgi:hypothetical protein
MSRVKLLKGAILGLGQRGVPGGIYDVPEELAVELVDNCVGEYLDKAQPGAADAKHAEAQPAEERCDTDQAVVKVKLLKSVILGPGRRGVPGGIYDVPAESAAQLVHCRLAEYIGEAEPTAAST